MTALAPAVALALLTIAATPQAAPKKPAYVADPRRWEHATSDLAPDPKIHFGSFKNGFRYAWVQNANPPKQIMLRMHVNVGSLAEKGDELGLAHFLEHMAFNGSKNFKAGTLVPTFQNWGIRFGSDVNAHTSFEETTYELDLPDDEPKRLEKALLWFRDVVDGLKLEPAEITAEKGVVDAEQTMRSGPGQELFVERFRHLLDGSRYPRRIVIGEQPTRAKFDKKIVTGFYDRWYRPENMTLVLVGDLGGKDPTPLLEKAFGEAKGRGAAEENPGAALDGLTFARTFFTEHLGGTEISLAVGKVRARVDPPDDSKARAADLALNLACDVLVARMNAIAPRPYVLAQAGGGNAFPFGEAYVFQPVLDGVALQLETSEEDWVAALKFASREIRRLLKDGLSDAELTAAKKRFDEQLAKGQAPGPPSNDALLAQVLKAANERYVPMEERAAKELVRKAGQALTKEQCLAAFKGEWEQGKLLICSVGALDLRDSAAETFADAWTDAEASRLDVTPTFKNDLSAKAPKPEPKPAAGAESGATDKKEAAAKFAYALPDQAAETSERQNHPELHAERLLFKNGVRALVKWVDGHEGAFRFEVRVGEGLLALDPAQADVAKVASRVFLEGGTSQATRKVIDEALAAAGAELGFVVDGDACTFTGESAKTGGEPGLRRALEAVCAYLGDAAYSEEKFRDFKRKLDENVPDLDRPTAPNARKNFQKKLANGDARFMPLERAGAAKIELDVVKKFLASQLDGPIEITVVGQIPLDRLIRNVESTLGQLPARRAPDQIPDARRTTPPQRLGLFEPCSAIDIAGDDCELMIVYPCSDAFDVAAERRFDLLGDLVMDRLRLDVREKLGATYSQSGSAYGSTVFRDHGSVEARTLVEPAKLKETREACLASMERLAKSGATKEEFERLRTSRAGNPEALARDLDFWLAELGRAHRAPAVLDDLKNLRGWYDRVTLAEINALCKQLLTRDRASVLQISPQ